MNALRKDALMRRAMRGADVLPLPALVCAASAPRPAHGTLRARRHASASAARKASKPAPEGFEAWRKALEKRIRELDHKSPRFTGAAAEKERAALLARAGKPEVCEYGEIFSDGTTEFLRYNGTAKIEAALERANGLRRLAAKKTGPAKGIPCAPIRDSWDAEHHAAMLNILEREHAHVEVRGGLLCRVACPADCTRKAGK